ncbi:endoribonuclease MazF [Nitratifractor sp.]
MKRGKYVPERWDIVWLDFNPQSGHEQRGRRPALVLSPRIYNEKTSLCLCLPITSKVKGYPFEVPLEGLPVEGVVLSDQLKSLDFRAREASFLCKVPQEIVRIVQENVIALVME